MLLVTTQQTSYLKMICTFIWSFFSWHSIEDVGLHKIIASVEKWPHKPLTAHYIKQIDESEEEYRHNLNVRKELFSIEERVGEEVGGVIQRTYNLWI